MSMLFEEVVETVTESNSVFSEISPVGAAAIAGGIALVAGICYGGYKLYKSNSIIADLKNKINEKMKNQEEKKEETKEEETK